MVICFEWHRTAVDPKSSSSGLPMTGEDTGLGALASPLVGYLGKVQERAASLEYCPWCTAKGSTYALRSYRINLQDSITLCTNPQCLFPLVSRSLEDVLASLDPSEPSGGNKRKNAPTLEEEEPIKPSHKRRRSSELEPQGAVDKVVSNGDESMNGNMETGQEEEEEDAASEPEEVISLCSLDANQPRRTNEHVNSPEIDTQTSEESPAADAAACKADGGFKETEDSSSAVRSEELVPVPDRLFWRNSDNLCWLDSLLVAVVNCRSLRSRRPEEEPQRSAVWQLMGRYEDVCDAVRGHQQTEGDGVVRVPLHVLQKAEAELQSLRMSVFKLLQPKLHCKLGQRETPVFALPLLLQSDSWAETIFMSTFHWEFSCSECKSFTTERVKKTLPTFTSVLAGWRPLDAVHSAPCNVCRKKNQRRTMKLESVPAVFGLHFVDGLPDGDVRNYDFTFNGKRHSVSAVIQYEQTLKHFVTWIRNPDGSWLEFDDLKHPSCASHQRLLVPAEEMHVVFWEAGEDKDSRSCSPSSTFPEAPLSENKPAEELTAADELPDQSRLESHDDTAAIVSALTDGGDVMDATLTAGADTSIGSTTLLDAFEGLSHSDIITLTLVELNPETVNDDKQTEDSSSRVEAPDSTPDSSSAVTGSESAAAVELPAGASSAEDTAGDPTFVPGGKGARRKGRGAAGNAPTPRRQSLRQAAAAKAPPASSEANTPPTSSEANTPPVQAPRQASPESSTDAPTSQKSPTMPPESARWSFLLSKHPLNQVNKSIAKVAAAQTCAVQVQPFRHAHSTPIPARRPHAPAGIFPKPQLRTEESEGLPLKAAEMYGGFGAKSSKTPSALTPPARLSVTNATPAPAPTLSTPLPPEITSLKKHSKLPAGLSDTDVLRYKLIKKLKAKKKKLAKLNQMLGQPGAAGLRPDSTALGSPGAVTSSTYDGAISDDLLSDLLSPATTASNLSPDSTGLLEMLAGGQDGGEQMECGVNAAPQTNPPNNDNFLDEFLTQAVTQTPTDMETEALSALELFI